jgi:hypothetical protein
MERKAHVASHAAKRHGHGCALVDHRTPERSQRKGEFRAAEGTLSYPRQFFIRNESPTTPKHQTQAAEKNPPSAIAGVN